jgi:GNAT superfamily N-acetyltransferase
MRPDNASSRRRGLVWLVHFDSAPLARQFAYTRTALDMMMVDPAYQRMGAGRLLVKWGLAEAEKMGVDAS